MSRLKATPVEDSLHSIFPQSAIRVDGSTIKLNVDRLDGPELRPLAALTKVTDIQIKRSGTGMVIIAQEIGNH